MILRLTGGSKTSAVACDGSGASDFRDAIVYGCKTPYQLNATGACPEASPPPGQATCVPNKTGSMVGPTEKALDDRRPVRLHINSPQIPIDRSDVYRVYADPKEALEAVGLSE